MEGKLSLKQRNFITRFIGTGLQDFELLYSFTRDGANAKTFHQKCDNKGPTVTVIYNTKQSIYGGYVRESWKSDSNGAYVTDRKAFLFCLMSNDEVFLNKFSVKQPDKAFYCIDTHGPVFGSGPDLDVFSDTLTAQGNQFSLNGVMKMGKDYDMGGVSVGKITNNVQTVFDVEVYSLSDSIIYSYTETHGGFCRRVNLNFSKRTRTSHQNYPRLGDVNRDRGYLSQGMMDEWFNTGMPLSKKRTPIFEPSLCKDSPLVRGWRTSTGWTLKDLKKLMQFALLFAPPFSLEIEASNILVVGPVGAGKSSFFNTVASVFRGHISDQAVCGSAEKSITSKYRMYRVRKSQYQTPLKFCLCDTMGIEENQGIDALELSYILDGHVPDGYQFNPTTPISEEMQGFVKHPSLGQKIHCVCFVFDGNTATILSEKMLEKVKRMLAKVRQKEVEENVTNVYQSKTIEHLVDKVSNIFGVPRSFILPLKNYEKEVDVDTHVSILAMHTLKRLLLSTENHLFNFLDTIDDKQQEVKGRHDI